MSQKPLFHFEISERKVLLRLFDMLAVLLTLSVVGIVFKFDYFTISNDNWYWTVLFLIYLNLFANIFELYDLQKADRFDSVIKNVIVNHKCYSAFLHANAFPNAKSTRESIANPVFLPFGSRCAFNMEVSVYFPYFLP